MSVGKILRAPGRLGWAVLAVLAFLNHNLYICGLPVSWTTWFVSLGLSMLMAAASGAVYGAFALKRLNRTDEKGS